MIVPYFDYGDVVYDTANADCLDKLQRLQNRFLKICKLLNIRHDTEHLHVITKTPKLRVRRECHINNFMYSRLSREDLLDGHNIRTRAHDVPLFDVKVPKIKTYKRAVEYAGAVRWNSLPAEVRNIQSFPAFKQKQRKDMYESVAP